MSNSQFNKLKLGIKNSTQVLKYSSKILSPNAVNESNDKSNFPHRLLLTDTNVSNIR